MEIILKEDIIGLGYKNDIVNVKSGYGRNYLIPTGKAVIASPSAKKVLAENLKQQAHKLERLKAEAEKKANELKQRTLTDNIIKEKFIEKWDGQLPKVTSGNTIIDMDELIK